MTSRRQFILNSALATTGCAVFPNTLIGGTGPSIDDKFKPSWESLKQYECPQWYRDAKFGIWAHWGPQSVPELTDWYARFLYISQREGGESDWLKRNIPRTYQYHLENYGHPSEFGHKDICNLFTASKFDPDRLLDLYARAGAEYFVALANHHDNYDNWNSKYQAWNSMNVGPKKDLIGMWEKATRAQGLRFGVSSHCASAWRWFEVSRGSDPDGPMKGVPYDGNLTKADGKGKWWEGLDPADLYCRPHKPGEPADEAYLKNYYNRITDLLESYRPDLIYFDGGLPFGDVGLNLVANYYNSNTLWNDGSLEAVVNLKRVPEKRRSSVVNDIERGQAENIEPWPWQTDTCIGGWYYVKDIQYKTAAQVVPMLADIVSKNGNLLLGVPQRGDGSIDSLEQAFLEEMAAWMSINKEAIFGTRPWTTFGEGPTRVQGGQKNEAANMRGYTAEDIRFTTKDNSLYAILLGWPEKEILITSLPQSNKLWFGKINNVELLGSKKILAWKQDEEGLTVQMPKEKPCHHAYALKISG
ncbi:alpha-L-fucosidase [Bacteroidota bacterium]